MIDIFRYPTGDPRILYFFYPGVSYERDIQGIIIVVIGWRKVGYSNPGKDAEKYFQDVKMWKRMMCSP